MNDIVMETIPIFVSDNVSIEIDEQVVVTAMDPSTPYTNTIQYVSNTNHANEFVVDPTHIVENTTYMVIKTDVEIATVLFEEIMEIFMNSNEKKVTYISRNILNDIINYATNLVNHVEVDPSMTLEEALVAQVMKKETNEPMEAYGISEAFAKYVSRDYARVELGTKLACQSIGTQTEEKKMIVFLESSD